MRKYEVDRVHNSKDGEIYQIAQSVEQKVRTGMLMPDYEMSQKPFHHWGDVILNYLEPDKFVSESSETINFKCNDLNNWFESTCEVKEIEVDEKGGYVSEIWVDSQCMKSYTNAGHRQIQSQWYAISFTYDYGDDIILEFYDENNDEWVGIDYTRMNEHHGHYTERNFKFDGSDEHGSCAVKIRCNNHQKWVRIRSNVGFLNKKENYVHGYAKYILSEGHIGKGVVLSKNKQWIYVESDCLHDVCVKHGGMKYIGDSDKTIYKMTRKNSRKFGKQGLLYYGYNRIRNGKSGKQYKEANECKKRVGWIKCNWLSNDFTLLNTKSLYEIVKLLYRKHIHNYPPNEGVVRAHFIRVNIEENCYELWNLTAVTERPRNYTGEVPFIKPIFLKTLPKDVVFKILEKKYADKIVEKKYADKIVEEDDEGFGDLFD